MQELAANLYLFQGFPRYAINVYLVGDVLLDAATRYHTRTILNQLRGRTVTAHALTHVHPDHQGASKRICETLDIPLWCGAAGVTAMESGNLSTQTPRNLVTWLMNHYLAGPGHPVARTLSEGDAVADFTVLDAPGHSPCQIALWRARDRTLILGDVLNNASTLTGQVGLREPPHIYTPDPARNRESARKLAALRPALVCFGHGPPLQDGRKFVAFVEGLAE